MIYKATFNLFLYFRTFYLLATVIEVNLITECFCYSIRCDFSRYVNVIEWHSFTCWGQCKRQENMQLISLIHNFVFINYFYIRWRLM